MDRLSVRHEALKSCMYELKSTLLVHAATNVGSQAEEEKIFALAEHLSALEERLRVLERKKPTQKRVQHQSTQRVLASEIAI